MHDEIQLAFNQFLVQNSLKVWTLSQLVTNKDNWNDPRQNDDDDEPKQRGSGVVVNLRKPASGFWSAIFFQWSFITL